ncbi:DUF4177 domain-containing protein [Shouchella lonarensis]|uniref:DUF4177 domain-containing protein n=1 Tax=Shouchella lonarensis TaxID=1464122 RepID=A0A1G6IMP7_9BACI|nr:DUF4177 domain-containing protein [Shouchella lonarensis]SDC07822.1 protein of unknown function [Shouchella lonarensis]
MQYKVEIIQPKLSGKKLAINMEDLLNEHAQNGWTLHSLVPQVSTFGGVDHYICVLQKG